MHVCVRVSIKFRRTEQDRADIVVAHTSLLSSSLFKRDRVALSRASFAVAANIICVCLCRTTVFHLSNCKTPRPKRSERTKTKNHVWWTHVCTNPIIMRTTFMIRNILQEERLQNAAKDFERMGSRSETTALTAAN